MLSVFSFNRNTTVSEKELYAPVNVAACILVYGTTRSGFDVVAKAVALQAPSLKDWKASCVLNHNARILGASFELIRVKGGHFPSQWYMDEFGYNCDVDSQVDSMISLLRDGDQVITYMHATDPILRMKSICAERLQDKFEQLEELFAQRGCRTIHVTRSASTGDVCVMTNEAQHLSLN